MSTSASFLLPYTPPATIDVGPSPTTTSPRVSDVRDFREHARAISPGFLRGPRAERFMGLLGLVFDTICQGALTAVFQRNMISKEFTPTSLALLSAERMLPRYPGESLYDHYLRVHDAWRIWQSAGSEAGIVAQLEQYGVSAQVVMSSDFPFLGGSTNDWSRAVAVVVPRFDDNNNISTRFTSEGTWGDGRIYGDGGTWGSTASLSEVDALRRILRSMKPGHIRVEHALVFLSIEEPSEMTGTWDDPAHRPSEVAFWDG